VILDRGPHFVDSWRFDVAGPRLAGGRPNAALAQAIAALPPVAAILRAAGLLIIERASARIAGRQLRIDLAGGHPDPIAAALGAVTARWSTTPLCDVRFEGHGALAGFATPLPMPGLVDLSADDLDGHGCVSIATRYDAWPAGGRDAARLRAALEAIAGALGAPRHGLRVDHDGTPPYHQPPP